jgi:hypothetical protein
MAEAEYSTIRSDLAKARQFRNGLMVATLALHPIRLKNFASLEIRRNFVNIEGRWWIILGAGETKEKRPDERRLDDMLAPSLEKYLSKYRDVLAQESDSNALWLSSADGQPMTYSAVADAIHFDGNRGRGLFTFVSDCGCIKRGGPRWSQPVPRKRSTSSPRPARHRGTLQPCDKPERRQRIRPDYQAKPRIIRCTRVTNGCRWAKTR